MIDTINKLDCCGCQGCVQRCPKNCIVLVEDEHGFLYPSIDKLCCVNCGLCDTVCPSINFKTNTTPPSYVIALKHKDDIIREQSSSGGAFTAIASYIIEKGGVVFGAAFDSEWRVVHSYVETISDLGIFRGSKYVQSYIGDAYIKVESFLKSGKLVLFSGTPCQISALKLFLRKSYSNLVTIDFVCHGVPSPGIFRWHLQEQINKIALKQKLKTNAPKLKSIPQDPVFIPKSMEITNIRFRDKMFGWKLFSFALYTKCHFESVEKEVIVRHNVLKDAFLRGFIHNLFLRPSCFNCKSKGLNSGSDLTLADYWGQKIEFSEFDNDKGVSAIIVNSSTGIDIMKNIKDVTFIQRPFEEFVKYNPSVKKSVAKTEFSKKFWQEVGKSSFRKTITKMVIYIKCDLAIKKIKAIINI